MLLLFAFACAPTPEAAGPTAGDTAEDCSWEAPSNTWSVSVPPGCPTGEGFAEGQTVPDLRLVDQFGDTVSLWQFHGDLILLDFSSMWGTQMWPREIASVGADHAGAGVMTVSVLFEDAQGDIPDQEDVEDWIQYTGAVGPVLTDTEDHWEAVSDTQAFPYILLINRELEVVEENLHWHEEGRIREAVESRL